jgi:ATP-dependent Clp protease adaptor protein ClpS
MADQAVQTPEKPKAKPSKKPIAKRSRRVKRLPPFNVVLLDDPKHTYDYVIEMLGDLFAHPPEKAFRLAEQVDATGRAIVATTHREHAELKRDQILDYGADHRHPECDSSMRAVIEPAAG